MLRVQLFAETSRRRASAASNVRMCVRHNHCLTAMPGVGRSQRDTMHSTCGRRVCKVHKIAAQRNYEFDVTAKRYVTETVRYACDKFEHVAHVEAVADVHCCR
jgi:hypothetical protein